MTTEPPTPTLEDCEDLAYQVADLLLEVQRENRRPGRDLGMGGVRRAP